MTATDGGSAIYLSGSANVTVRNCEFTNCYTSGNTGGGAIYASSTNSTLIVESSLFVGNKSTKCDGGAICTKAKSGSSISNCTFTGNYAYEDGGAVSIWGGRTEIINCTFYGNTACEHGGAIADVNGTTSVIKNTIAIGNSIESAYQYTVDVYSPYTAQGSVSTLDGGYNLFGKIGKASVDLPVAGTSKKNVTVSSPSGWFSITLSDNGGPTRTFALNDVSGSPAIDKISSGAPTYDQRGFARAGAGTAADIGAFEYGAVVSVSSVTLNKNSLTLIAGNSEQLTAAILPELAANKTVSWQSSDTGIATVDEFGNVCGVNPGTAVITVTTADGALTDTCNVTVTPAPATVSAVEVSPNTATVVKGESYDFTAVVTGQNNPSQDVVWTVSGQSGGSTSIADGKLTIGTAETAASLTVTATSTADDSKSGTAVVTVTSEFYVSTGEEFNHAMESALNPLIIHIDADLDGVNANPIAAAKTVIIHGGEHTVTQADGGAAAHMDASTGNRIEIYDLTIIGGEARTNKNGGGAIYLAGGDVYLENVIIKDCSVEYVADVNNGLRFGGGAVSVALADTPTSIASNGSITALNCAFIGNAAGHTYDNFGGGALCADKVYLTNCTFWGNSAADSPGGAVYTRIGGSMTNCTVVNNTALTGGGVTSRTNEVDGDNSRIHLLNSIVVGNHTKVDAVTGATGSLGGNSGVNVDQSYDQGGNIFGYVHTIIDSDYRDIIYSANGIRKPATTSIWNVTIENLKTWLDYGEPTEATGYTIPLLDVPNNPAINKGVMTGTVDSSPPALTAPTEDQRGETRDAIPDIGSYEFTYALTPAVLSVTVSPESASVQKGSTQQFAAIVEVWAGAAQTIQWSVSGAESSDTSISEGGLLTVGEDESAEILTITATSTEDANVCDSAAVTVTEIPPPPSYGVALSVPAHTFPAAKEGYEQPDALSVTVTNTGNQATGDLAIEIDDENANAFELSDIYIEDIATENNAVFTIVPVAGLSEGVYEATVTVSGDNDISAVITVSFTVSRLYTGGSSGSSNDSYRPSAPVLPVTSADPASPDASSGAADTANTKALDDNPFTDIAPENLFYSDVLSLYKRGLINGSTADTFSPQTSATRGMTATILGRLAKVNADEYAIGSFDDVAERKYYAGYVEWAKETGIVKGITDRLFMPDKAVTRQDLAVLIVRYAEYFGIELPIIREYSGFEDSADISDYAREAIAACFKAGIINGDSGNRFNPKSNVTRAEFAAMLNRFVDTTE
jgi:predicted outer membrane repeat protein